MGINSSQFREYIIRETLNALPDYMRGDTAEKLLLATALHEGDGLQALRQYNDGPARGIYQMEFAAYMDAMAWFGRHPKDYERFADIYGQIPRHDNLSGNLYWATALARIYYYMQPFKMPHEGADIMKLAIIWHKHWCKGCAGTPEQFIASWKRGTRNA